MCARNKLKETTCTKQNDVKTKQISFFYPYKWLPSSSSSWYDTDDNSTFDASFCSIFFSLSLSQLSTHSLTDTFFFPSIFFCSCFI